MAYDATRMTDWQISEAAEQQMKSVWQFGEEMGLKKDEVIRVRPYRQGRFHEDHRPAEGQAGRQVHRGDRYHPDPAG